MLRAGGIGLCLTVFGVAGVLSGLLLFPIARAAPVGPERRRDWAQWLIHRLCRLFVRLTRALGLLDDRLYAADRLEQSGAVIVANHPSLLDVVLLLARLRRVDCVVKPNLRYRPATAVAVRMAGYITRAEGPALVERCCAALADGRCLLIFPSGTREAPDQPLKFERGAARIALHAGAPLIPVVIRMRPPVLGKSQRWYHAPASVITVSISVDEPLDIDDYIKRDSRLAVAARELTADLTRYFNRRLSTNVYDCTDDRRRD